MEHATVLMQQLKDRLQSQHDGLAHVEDDDSAGRLMVRAELDALWACVEVLAQRLDGVEEPVARDYFAETRRGLKRTATGRPPRRSWRRKRDDHE